MDGVSERDSGWDGAQLQHVEPGYRQVLRLRLVALWLPLSIAALVADNAALGGTPYYGLASIAVPLIAILVVAIAPQRFNRRLATASRTAARWCAAGFSTPTPSSVRRVQHLDVTRGPLDKMFGTATLVVHTAGTRNSIVTVPGLAPDRAAEIRDIIREHIRTDFE